VEERGEGGIKGKREGEREGGVEVVGNREGVSVRV
jgi:hypothetical protein